MRTADQLPKASKAYPWSIVVLFVCLVGGPAGAAHGQDNDNMAALQEIGRAFGRIAEQAYPGVVTIVVGRSASSEDTLRGMLRQRGSRSRSETGDAQEGLTDPGRPRPSAPEDLMRRLPAQPVRQLSRGLGIIVSEDGRIITNNHVVRGANRIEVKLIDGRSFQGKVVGTDPATDIAVLKIEAEDLKVLELGDSDTIELGDWLIGIGNPMGIGWSLRVGLVTGKNRRGLGMADYEDFIQTDAAPSLGDDGGPMLDLKGLVIGVNTAVIGSEYGGGIGLAIPINMVKTVYEQLIKTGVVERGFMGIMLQDLDAKMARALGLEEVTGVVIANVIEGSPAAEAGLHSGDVIVDFAGEEATSSSQLRQAVAALKPGKHVEVVVIRRGETKRFTVTLGQRPSAR